MINHSVYYSTTPVVRELDACTPRLLSRGRYRGRPTVSSGPACTASYVECRASSRPCRGASHGHREAKEQEEGSHHCQTCPRASGGTAGTAPHSACRAPCPVVSQGHVVNIEEERPRTVAGDAQVGADGVQARAPVLLVRHHILLAGHRRRAGAPAGAGRRRLGRDERALCRRGALGARVAARVRVGRRLVRRRALARERGCGGGATSST